MNKRMKKKWSRIERLENKVAQLMAENAMLTNAIKSQRTSASTLQSLVERNAQATNSRFDALEGENKRLRVDLESAVIELRRPRKKSWFGK